jgi:hypothetical protein
MQVEEESPKQYVDIARAPDKEMRPDRPVPSGVVARTVGCIVALLDHIDRLSPEFDSGDSPAFVGRLASGPSWPQRITRLVMKQVLHRDIATREDVRTDFGDPPRAHVAEGPLHFV